MMRYTGKLYRKNHIKIYRTETGFHLKKIEIIKQTDFVYEYVAFVRHLSTK